MTFRMIVKATLLAIGMLSTGCSTYAATRYTSSVDNLTPLRALRDEGQALNVGEFRTVGAASSEIMCRALGPIKTPDGESFATYIRKALITELKYAELYAEKAPVTLSGTLEQIDFSSMDGAWNLKLSVQSSNGNKVTVSQRYNFTSSWVAETACNQTAQALMPAVQDLIKQLVGGKKFASLVRADANGMALAEEKEEAAPAPKTYLTDCPEKAGESTRERVIRCKALATEQGGVTQ